MENIQLSISAHDIEASRDLGPNPQRSFALSTPVCLAMERVTGSSWKAIGSWMMMEETAPFRFSVVPVELEEKLCHFLHSREMEPCSYIIDLDCLTASLLKPTSNLETVAPQ